MDVLEQTCACSDLDLISLVSGDAIEPEFRRVKAGELVWDAANGDGKLVVVKEGMVRVYHGATASRQRLTHVVGPGHWVGTESLAGVRGETRVIAAEASLVAILDASRVIERALANPTHARTLIQHLAGQSVGQANEITELRTQDCTSQVVHTLLRLSRCGAATPTNEGNRVTLHITQQDVADAVGIARETVNAMIQKLAEQNLIQKQRGRITFDPNALANAADSFRASHN